MTLDKNDLKLIILSDPEATHRWITLFKYSNGYDHIAIGNDYCYLVYIYATILFELRSEKFEFELSWRHFL